MTDTINGYDEYTVVRDGVLEQIVCVVDDEIIDVNYGMEEPGGTLIASWLDEYEAAAYADGEETAIYVTAHPHEVNTDCACAQYDQDHTPDYLFEAEAGD